MGVIYAIFVCTAFSCNMVTDKDLFGRPFVSMAECQQDVAIYLRNERNSGRAGPPDHLVCKQAEVMLPPVWR